MKKNLWTELKKDKVRMIDELIFSLMRKKGYNCQSTFKENIFNPTSIIETANTV